MNEDESESIAEILHELSTTSHVQVRSSTDLATQVTKAAADEDEERREGGRGPLRRRTGFRAVPTASRSLTVTPWQVIHAIGLGAASARQGAGRGLAEHWGTKDDATLSMMFMPTQSGCETPSTACTASTSSAPTTSTA